MVSVYDGREVSEAGERRMRLRRMVGGRRDASWTVGADASVAAAIVVAIVVVVSSSWFVSVSDIVPFVCDSKDGIVVVGDVSDVHIRLGRDSFFLLDSSLTLEKTARYVYRRIDDREGCLATMSNTLAMV